MYYQHPGWRQDAVPQSAKPDSVPAHHDPRAGHHASNTDWIYGIEPAVTYECPLCIGGRGRQMLQDGAYIGGDLAPMTGSTVKTLYALCQ